MDYDEFYEKRTKQFDEERKILADYLKLITPGQNELHNIDWENKKLLQKSEENKAEMIKYDQEINKLKLLIESAHADIHDLQVAKHARTEQIQRLSYFKDPVQHDTTYIINENFPLKVNINDSGSSSSNKNGIGKVDNDRSLQKLFKPTKTGELLKAEKRIEFETAKVNLFQSNLIDYISDAEEFRYQYRLNRKEISRNTVHPLISKCAIVEETEYQTYLAVTELLRMRLNIMIAQREKIDEVEKLSEEKEYYMNKEEETKSQLINDMELLQKRMKTELQEVTAGFQQQLADLDIKIKDISLKAERINTNHNAKKAKDTENLEQAVLLAKHRYQQLEIRNNLEMEGYRTEANLLKGRLLQIEKLYKAFLYYHNNNNNHSYTTDINTHKSNTSNDNKNIDFGGKPASFTATVVHKGNSLMNSQSVSKHINHLANINHHNKQKRSSSA